MNTSDIRARIETALLTTLASVALRARITANHVTLAGVMACIVGAVILVTTRSVVPAFAWFAIGFFLDILDGPVARLSQTGSNQGRFLDSLADRLTESFAYISLAIWLTLENNHKGALVTIVLYALSSVASYLSVWMMIAFARERWPLTTRAHRLIILGFALLLFDNGYTSFAIFVIAIMSAATLCTIAIRVNAILIGFRSMGEAGP